MRMNTFPVKIMACNRTFFDGRCELLVVPLQDGEKGIMANHEDTVFATEIGEMRLRTADGETIHAVCGPGILQMINNRALLLLGSVEKPEEIDVYRAKEALLRAQEDLRHKQSRREYEHTQATISRAMSRLKVSKKYQIEGY